VIQSRKDYSKPRKNSKFWNHSDGLTKLTK
jgi:hypothetical protein